MGYKYVYVRTNKKTSVTCNKITQSLERQGFRRVTSSATRCNNVLNTNKHNQHGFFILSVVGLATQ